MVLAALNIAIGNGEPSKPVVTGAEHGAAAAEDTETVGARFERVPQNAPLFTGSAGRGNSTEECHCSEPEIVLVQRDLVGAHDTIERSPSGDRSV